MPCLGAAATGLKISWNTGGYGVIAMGAGLTRSIGVDANGSPIVRQYHMDGQGSVLAITDGLGNVVTNYQIDAWGNVLSGGAPGNAFDFLEWAWILERSGSPGLHYVRARWLNPQFGSWMSVDPHLDEFAYQYANNMPTTSTDPSGKDTVSDAVDTLHSLLGRNPHSLSMNQIGLLLEEDERTIGVRRVYLSLEERAFLGRLQANLVASAQSGVKAKDPNAKMLGDAHKPQLTTDHARPGQKKGGPASVPALPFGLDFRPALSNPLDILFASIRLQLA